MRLKTNEAEYQKIKQLLSESDVKSQTDLQEKINGMQRSAKNYSLIIACITLVLVAIFPRFAIFSILVSAVYLAWIWSSTLSGKHYFQRYLDEQKSPTTNDS